MNRYVAHIIAREDGSEFAQFPVFAEKPEWAIEQAQKALRPYLAARTLRNIASSSMTRAA